MLYTYSQVQSVNMHGYVITSTGWHALGRERILALQVGSISVGVVGCLCLCVLSVHPALLPQGQPQQVFIVIGHAG